MISGSTGVRGDRFGRYYVDNVIIIFPEIPQEGRQHRRRLGFGVVEQNNSPAGRLEPDRDELQLCMRRCLDNPGMPAKPEWPRACEWGKSIVNQALTRITHTSHHRGPMVFQSAA